MKPQAVFNMPSQMKQAVRRIAVTVSGLIREIRAIRARSPSQESNRGWR
jgi:hypothetical protein